VSSIGFCDSHLDTASATAVKRNADTCLASDTSPNVRPPWNAVNSFGHWEMDTIVSPDGRDCVVTLVERVTGCVLLGKLRSRTVAALNRRVIQLIRAHRSLFKTITVDNGTEFHGYRKIERATGTTFYFATPYHSWERGTNENTNGLIRQYIPKRSSMKDLTQAQCVTIAQRLNNRPRKRHRFLTPIECLSRYFDLK